MNTLPVDDAPEPPARAFALSSRLLSDAGFQNAFFTRLGGVSRPPWDTLNFASSTGDDPDAVRENLARAARHLGVPPARLYILSQVHGIDACVLEGVEDPAEIVRRVGDITASAVAGVACGVRTADCVPVLLADRRSGAVVAVHSGWRGTAQRAAAHGVARLRAIAGAEVELLAAVGPHIERCCFEVGEDVAGELARASRAGRAAVHEGASEGKRNVDLRAVVRAQLEDAGVAPGAVDDVRGCTVCDPARFHSFRRDGARSGRMLSAIVARG